MEIFRKNEIFPGIWEKGIPEKEFVRLKKSPGFLKRGIYRKLYKKGSSKASQPLERMYLSVPLGSSLRHRSVSLVLETGPAPGTSCRTAEGVRPPEQSPGLLGRLGSWPRCSGGYLCQGGRQGTVRPFRLWDRLRGYTMAWGKVHLPSCVHLCAQI